MPRSGPGRTCLIAVVVASAACVWPSPERQLLLDFFHACKVYDLTALAEVGTAPCNPRTDGVVDRFEILDVAATDAARTVTMRAMVRSFDGLSAERTMAATLSRQNGRWMVTGLTPLPASRTSPAASSVPPK